MRFADETASGPVSASSSRAIGFAGMRSATVPRVSPRSHCERRLRVEDDGEPAGPELADEVAHGSAAPRSASASRVGMPGMSTGGGEVRSRPFAVEEPCDRLAGSNASAATP